MKLSRVQTHCRGHITTSNPQEIGYRSAAGGKTQRSAQLLPWLHYEGGHAEPQIVPTTCSMDPSPYCTDALLSPHFFTQAQHPALNYADFALTVYP